MPSAILWSPSSKAAAWDDRRMNEEQRYVVKRIWKSKLQSMLFFLCRIFPVRRKKIVFCCIEGTTGYTCNPKYIAEEFIRRDQGYELVWLVDDMEKKFPEEIKKVHNTLWNRAYHLTTAHFWVDNSRKQLEVRKRRGQIYIQTWHAKLGFKPTCLDRGTSFSRIAYLVSKHDSNMIDYVLSNSKWYDDTLPTGMIYHGPVLRVGSPRCDILVNDRTEIRKKVRGNYGLSEHAKIIMYAPTFRGGSQGTERSIEVGGEFPDYDRLAGALERRFGGKWFVLVRLHPQVVARNMDMDVKAKNFIDVSRVDDMYEILAACDAFMTDYSSAAFDAAVMRIPIFLYAYDYAEYKEERGGLLWDLKELPFPLATNDDELEEGIGGFIEEMYLYKLRKLMETVDMTEDGRASEKVVTYLMERS